jgi:hypothetical protein
MAGSHPVPTVIGLGRRRTDRLLVMAGGSVADQTSDGKTRVLGQRKMRGSHAGISAVAAEARIVGYSPGESHRTNDQETAHAARRVCTLVREWRRQGRAKALTAAELRYRLEGSRCTVIETERMKPCGPTR